MKKVVFLLAILTLITQYSFAGGPWTPTKNEGIIIGNISPVIYKNYSSSTGETIDLRRRVTQVVTQGYFEMGMSNKLMLMGNLVLNYAGTSSTTFESDYFLGLSQPSTLLPPGRVFGMGNSSIGMKYRFNDNKILFAMSFQIEFPATTEKFMEGLRTGYNSWTFLPGIHLGQGYARGVYFFVEGYFGAHVADNQKQISHEYRINAEVGYEFNVPLTMAFAVHVKESLKNITRTDNLNFQQTGLYLNNQEYITWEFKFMYDINENFGFNTALAGGFRTELIARTPVISAGMYFKWKVKPYEPPVKE
jgi:hypothetical protein